MTPAAAASPAGAPTPASVPNVFSTYVAGMHRTIHALWADGTIAEWDKKPPQSPVNDPKLEATLEIVLNSDGSIDNVKVVKSSGVNDFDVSVIDVAYGAGPYPDPPAAMLSANGKIYIHWTFHRDNQQCNTSGVNYYILKNAQLKETADAPQNSASPPVPK